MNAHGTRTSAAAIARFTGWIGRPTYAGLVCFAVHSVAALLMFLWVWLALRSGSSDVWGAGWHRFFGLDTPATPIVWFWFIGLVPLGEVFPTNSDRLLWFSVVGGIQWFCIGFLVKGGWMLVQTARSAGRWIPFIIGVTLNVGGTLSATEGILRLKEVAYPPFWLGVYTILPVFYWPPLWLVAFWGSSTGAIVMWVYCLASPGLLMLMRRQLAVYTSVWVTFALISLVPALMGVWIWLHAKINTFGD